MSPYNWNSSASRMFEVGSSDSRGNLSHYFVHERNRGVRPEISLE